MIPETLKPEGTALKRWVFFDDIIKYTGNRDIIRQELTQLKQTRIPLQIRRGGFESSSSIVIDFNDRQLVLDRPAIWVPVKGQVALAYAFPGQPRREMRSEITKETNEGIILKFPYILGETEHREFYRISVPSVSMLIAYGLSEATGRKRILFEGKIKDISMKGVCSLTTSIYTSVPLTKETEVTEIVLKLMISNMDYFSDITIKSPKIVRLRKTGLTRDGKTGYEIAFSFKPDSKTSDRIFAYMRQREKHVFSRK